MTADVTKREAELSTFVLDVYWSSGRAGDPAIDEHVATCERCRAYLDELDAQERAPVATSSVKLRARRGWAWPASIAALAAGAVLFVFVAGERGIESNGYVGVKGTPAVQVLVHRGHDTRIWDGRSPLRPGDALAFRVACEGLNHVVVAAPGRAGWTRLSGAECPAQETALPFTLQVDAAPGDERVAVVLSRNEVDDQTLQEAIEETRRATDLWVVSFVLPKEMETER